MSTPKDPDEKVRRGYLEPDSIVWQDGREKLVGRDWRNRIKELEVRSKGICEYTFQAGRTVVRCRAAADDPHHVVKRSVLRDDRLENLQALCRAHHRLIDERKIGGRP